MKLKGPNDILLLELRELEILGEYIELEGEQWDRRMFIIEYLESQGFDPMRDVMSVANYDWCPDSE